MAVIGKRLPAEYVIAFVDDLAINWQASCRKLGLELSEDADHASEGRAAYLDVRATARLPLVAYPGATITTAVCRPLLHGEFQAIRDRYFAETETIEIAEGDKREVVKDLAGYCRALVDLAVVRVEGLEPAPYDSAEDLTQAQIVELGLSIARLNTLPAEVRVF
jgi:hypothetical protein